jgi:uncharacterized phage protein gp47/JayE
VRKEDVPVSTDGYTRPSFEELLQRIVRRAHATVSPGLDFSAGSPLGEVTRILVDIVDEALGDVEVCYNAMDRDKAGAFLLDALGKITLTHRRGEAPSEVNASCTLTAGTTLLAGTHFAALASDPDVRATPKEDFTAPSTGTFPVRFRAEQAGPIEIPAGDLTVVATAVTGWTAVTNDDPGFPGHLADEDPLYRLRQEQELSAGGSGTPEAQKAAIAALDGVVTVIVNENVDDARDANGLPGHSTEAIIWDNSGGADDDEIAQTILAKKAGGAKVFGIGSSGTAKDANGADVTVPFTRSAELEIYLTYTVTRGPKYVGDTEFKARIEKEANALHGNGDDVGHARLQGLPFELGLGIAAVPSPTLTLGLSVSPVGTADIPVTVRKIARFSTLRIVVNSS